MAKLKCPTRKPYFAQLSLWSPQGGYWEVVAERFFRSLSAAEKQGEVWNWRHCHETKYGSRHPNYVCVGNHKTDQSETLAPYYDLLTVGEVGYW